MDNVNNENNSMTEISQVIDGKANLPFEVQDDIKNLLNILVQVFDLDTSFITKKIENLEITKMPLYGEYEDIVVKGNKLLINPRFILKKNSGQSIYVQGILKYLYPNNSTGLDALYNGIIEMASNTVVGDSNISDEFAMCDILSKIIEPNLNNPEPLMTSLFSGNLASCLLKLQDKGVTKEEIAKLMNIANQNYMTTKIRKKSNLASIERMLIDFKFRQNPSMEEMQDFTESLRISSELYGGKQKQYEDLDALGIEYQQKLQEYLNSINSTKTR